VSLLLRPDRTKSDRPRTVIAGVNLLLRKFVWLYRTNCMQIQQAMHERSKILARHPALNHAFGPLFISLSNLESRR
jgi:hypothetical protein